MLDADLIKLNLRKIPLQFHPTHQKRTFSITQKITFIQQNLKSTRSSFNFFMIKEDLFNS